MALAAVCLKNSGPYILPQMEGYKDEYRSNSSLAMDNLYSYLQLLLGLIEYDTLD
jgi:hypothetical protein